MVVSNRIWSGSILPRRVILMTTLVVAALVTTVGVFGQQSSFDFRSLDADTGAAIFAGGCFWCIESAFEEVPGVVAAISGYSGGTYERPTYRIVAHGGTGHIEAVLVLYDRDRLSYRDLLEIFWINIDPHDPNGQFCDRGMTYQAAIFYRSAVQRVLAEESRRALDQQLTDAVETQVRPVATFWIAEDYHQDYYREHEFNYNYYRDKCGRDDRLERLWGAKERRRALMRDLLGDI